jgi:hypothetical protein
MLVECGLTRAQLPDGSEWTFRPSLGRIAELGSPREIVELYAALCGGSGAPVPVVGAEMQPWAGAWLQPWGGMPDRRSQHMVAAAERILAALCDTEDVTPLTGWRDADGWHPGAMPEAEMVLIAQHLMRHGICGKARPGSGEGGGYAQEFHAAEHVAAAVAHLGVSRDEALDMSMTELQLLFEAKFPDAAKKRDVPTEDEYAAFMSRMKELGHVG